jgi:hypothetical protein
MIGEEKSLWFAVADREVAHARAASAAASCVFD